MTVSATLSIEVNVDCPHCDEVLINLCDDQFRLNDEGAIYQEAVPSGDWTRSHEDFEIEIECPECKKTINVKGINW